MARTKNAAHAAARRGSVTSWPILPDSRPSVGRGVPPPEIGEWAQKSSLRRSASLLEARNDEPLAERTAHFTSPPGEGKRSRSRDAFQRPSYGKPLSESVTTDLIRWFMLSCSRKMPVEALASVDSAWMLGSSPTMTKEERKCRRRNADRRNRYSAARLDRQAHIYRRSTAVLAPRSLSSQGTQPQARLPGTWRDTFCVLSGR